MNDEMLERVETRMAFLERANNELSDVVYRQQREISQLRERLAALTERVEAVQAAQEALPPAEEKPPHY